MPLLEPLRAIADEGRLRILRALARASFNVQELTTIVGLSQPAVSHHLKVLQKANLVQTRREGTWIYYTLTDTAALNGIGKVMEALCTSLQSGDALPNAHTDAQAIARILDSRRSQSHQFFESIAPQWRSLATAHGSALYLDEFARDLDPAKTVLELGCGSGTFLERILPRRGVTIGVDFSQAMLDETKRNLKQQGLSADLRLGFLERLPVESLSVDIAVAGMVLHHVAEPLEALRDVFRVLKPGGSLLIADLMRHQEETMRTRFADLWLGFDPGEIEAWLWRAGFINAETVLLGDEKQIFFVRTFKP
jgi:ubiquinone/menaquinone biosynthesis C-methylase UbiE/DNA-binding transcriptional ArsR family regulator